MKPRSLLAAAAFVSAIALPGVASAVDGYATASVNFRAGPGTQYPVVGTLYPGAPVEVFGCLSGISWCDVYWNGDRGWVSGKYLQTVYAGNRVYVPGYAARIGIPTVSFSFGYWDDHYRDRRFYRDWDRYDRREFRRDRREDRREVREERREDRREFRRDRREDRREARQERRERRS